MNIINKTSFLDLPDEIIQLISNYLDILSISNYKKTCSLLNSLISFDEKINFDYGNLSQYLVEKHNLRYFKPKLYSNIIENAELLNNYNRVISDDFVKTVPFVKFFDIPCDLGSNYKNVIIIAYYKYIYLCPCISFFTEPKLIKLYDKILDICYTKQDNFFDYILENKNNGKLIINTDKNICIINIPGGFATTNDFIGWKFYDKNGLILAANLFNFVYCIFYKYKEKYIMIFECIRGSNKKSFISYSKDFIEFMLSKNSELEFPKFNFETQQINPDHLQQIDQFAEMLKLYFDNKNTN